MESRCHLGKVHKYDTVTKLGWAVDIRAHGNGRTLHDARENEFTVHRLDLDTSFSTRAPPTPSVPNTLSSGQSHATVSSSSPLQDNEGGISGLQSSIIDQKLDVGNHGIRTRIAIRDGDVDPSRHTIMVKIDKKGRRQTRQVAY
ncbi:hypothetical protein NEOLEDRAFT_1184805 [Neolentinus lepideus HHB14362 ss-1]|uniref:Uncharacterized protein n=1 Tax=Neolentinus lepideus HHB14362 ss-1 TaxID=1314782 RepID=A0A165M5N1_9AGAM|nr:hypothetical protein NEOLEDRAFT_1184805 [Neolentinus lepideus HHB14362 ss-1]